MNTETDISKQKMIEILNAIAEAIDSGNSAPVADWANRLQDEVYDTRCETCGEILEGDECKNCSWTYP